MKNNKNLVWTNHIPGVLSSLDCTLLIPFPLSIRLTDSQGQDLRVRLPLPSTL